MSGQAWFKFFPGDWRSDSALRMCSPLARCLWIEMLCLMYEADPCGHLLVKGRPLSDAALAVQAGMSPPDVAAALAELEDHSVFSRTPDGVAFSRKMVRDARRSQEQRERAEARWAAKNALTADTEIIDETDFGIAGSMPHGSEPETRNQKPEKNPLLPSAPATDWPDGGIDVWLEKLASVSRGMADPMKNMRLVTGSSIIAQWKLNGFSFSIDVLPVIQGLCRNRKTPIGGWEYFNSAIREGYAKRIGYAAPVTAADISPQENRHDQRPDRPTRAYLDKQANLERAFAAPARTPDWPGRD